MAEQQSMGALFQQRRAAAAAGKKPAPTSAAPSPGNTPDAKKLSLLEIQAEQAQAARAKSPKGRGASSRGGGGGGGGGYNRGGNANSGGGGGGGGGGGYNNFSRNRSPHRSPPRGGGNQSSQRRSDRGQQQQYARHRGPLEQGAICSLKESFGFIRCADRMEELFFHYSQVGPGCHVADLQVGDEVEFGVSLRQDKLSAMEVRKLPEGTKIVWETEDEPGQKYRGLVERTGRQDRGGGSTEGTIRLLVETAEEDGPPVAKEGALVRFAAKDYEGPAGERNRRGPARLARGDFVEFSIVTERRSKEKYARSITLLLSERERARQEEEKRMLAEATVEHGVVTSLKGDYGFLMSNKRREEVYFHYSNVQLEGDDDDVVLKEGQDMKFLVVQEPTDSVQRKRLSARMVELQPRGSVKFHDVVAKGMTGKVTICPQPQDSSHSLDQQGRIHLDTPIPDVDEDGNERLVTEVYLSSQDSPGGSFPFRGGSSVGLWIQQGDTLLFNVVRDYSDGACRAVPTMHQVPRENPLNLRDADEIDYDEGLPSVRLIALTLAGRAEGTIHALKDSYGFIQYVERPVDVHFKLFQLLPEELQVDLRRNMGLADVDDRGKPLELTLDSEVHFDLSVHGLIHSSAHSGTPKKGRQGQNERENMKAQRILLVPPGTVTQTVVLTKDAKAVVSKEDIKQPFAGTVDLETAVKPMDPDVRHPLVAKMIDLFLASESKLPLVFHDLQSPKEDEIVINMFEAKGSGKVAWTYIPQAGESSYPGRLCIRKLEGDEAAQKAVSEEASSPSEPSEEKAGDEEDKEEENDSKNKSPKKKKQNKVKPVKTFRFDKGSLVTELKEDQPPGLEDVVLVDIVQSRRSGQISVENMRMVTRSEREVTEPPEVEGGLGVVKEVVAARKFGFISVLDENASTREMLYFNLSKQGNNIRKGDEVKFTVGTEKNGKRVALNVTVLSKGTIPNKAEKNACRGLVLLEPTHTSLKNTPLRHASSAGSQASDKSSRWDGVDLDRKRPATEEEPITEQGCILLLEDPSGMFKSKTAEPKREEVDAAEGSSQESPQSGGATSESNILSHLRYKNGAIAIHGTGASASGDDSSNPRRGDLVSFVKAKSGSGARDIRIVTRAAGSLLRGRLELTENGKAKFIAATEGEEEYVVDLSEVVSCDPSVLKANETVEGILHDGKIFGICRTVDLYLDSKLGTSHKLRPKLNLTVKKGLGGKIMAQSMMAKGPDGTNGFHAGWTTRQSKYAEAHPVGDGGETLSS